MQHWIRCNSLKETPKEEEKKHGSEQHVGLYMWFPLRRVMICTWGVVPVRRSTGTNVTSDLRDITGMMGSTKSHWKINHSHNRVSNINFKELLMGEITWSDCCFFFFFLHPSHILPFNPHLNTHIPGGKKAYLNVTNVLFHQSAVHTVENKHWNAPSSVPLFKNGETFLFMVFKHITPPVLQCTTAMMSLKRLIQSRLHLWSPDQTLAKEQIASLTSNQSA